MGWHSTGGGQKHASLAGTKHFSRSWLDLLKRKIRPILEPFRNLGVTMAMGLNVFNQHYLYIYHRTDFWKTRLGNDICIQRIESFGIHPGLSVHLDFQ